MIRRVRLVLVTLMLAVAGVAAVSAAQSVDVSITADSPVKMVNDNVDDTTSVTVEATNNFDGTMDVSLSYSTDSFYASPPASETLTVGPGETETTTGTVSIDESASHESSQDIQVSVDYSASNETGTHDSGGDTAGIDLLHPVELTVTIDDQGSAYGDELALGQDHSLQVSASEVYGWEGVYSIQNNGVDCSTPEGGNLGWGVSLNLVDDSVSAGADDDPIGTLDVPVPSTIDPRPFGDQPAECDIELSTDEDDHTVQASIDPEIPATLTVEWADPETMSFVFDAKQSEFDKQATLEVNNRGDGTWTGQPSLTYERHPNVRFEAEESVDLSGGESTRVDGRFVVPSNHKEGDFGHRVVVGSGDVPILNNDLSHIPNNLEDHLPYNVTYAAKLTRESVGAPVDLGPVAIGSPGQAKVEFRETLGYADVTLVPSQRLGNGTNNSLDLPDEVVVPAGQEKRVPVTFRPPSGSTPGCQLAWTVQWTPQSQRPLLEGTDHPVKAETQLANIDEALEAHERWGVNPDTETRQILERARSGCGLSGPEMQKAVRALRATVALQDLEAKELDSVSSTVQAAMRVQALDAIVSENDDATKALVDRFGSEREQVVDSLDAEARRLEESEPSPSAVDQLGRLAAAYEAVGKDPASVEQARAEMLDDLRGRYQKARTSVQDLYEVRADAPTGVAVSRDVAVNPNPLHWATVNGLQDAVDRDAARATAAFDRWGPLEDRVESAEQQATYELQSSRQALTTGGIVDAAVAVLFSGYGTLAFLRYIRDLKDAQLGADLLG